MAEKSMIDKFSDLNPSNLFGTHEYIATDYNKKNDIHKVLTFAFSRYHRHLSSIRNHYHSKAHLEDERNLNASFNRKPFKTLSYLHQAPSETFNFSIKKKIKSGISVSSSNLDDIDGRMLESIYGASPALDQKRSLVDAGLRKLKRNVYSTDEKERILKGHTHGQSGIILSTLDRKKTNKSDAMLKEWSTRIFVDLAENWPNLHFQIKVKDTDCDSGEGTVTAPQHTALNCSSSIDSDMLKFKEVKSHSHRGGAEELLIQFETDIQTLPPERALSRYIDQKAYTFLLTSRIHTLCLSLPIHLYIPPLTIPYILYLRELKMYLTSLS